MAVEVYIQGQRLDLFPDESINVTQVTQDLKDISKIFTDYSQTFNIPASRINNRILKNWFNADIDNGFDARTRVKAVIRLNTLDFKIGKVRLDGAEVENNQPKTYKLTFFGDVIRIKDLIGDDNLQSLDFLDDFEYTYSGLIVKNGLTQGLTLNGEPQAVIFPLISYNRQYFYNSTLTTANNTENAVNIAYDASNNDGVDSTELRPAVKLKLIIDAINDKYGLNFTSPFFDSDIFKSIYVNLSRNNTEVTEGSVIVDQQSGQFTPNGFNVVGCRYLSTVVPQSGFESVPFRVRQRLSGLTIFEEPTAYAGSRQVGNNNYNTPYSSPYLVETEIITDEAFTFNLTTQFDVLSYSNPNVMIEQNIFTNVLTSQNVLFDQTVTALLPDIKTYDFLTNIFKIFNLVATASNEQIYIESLQDWYTSGQIYDVTKFINLESKSISRGKIFREINFKFQESEQILAEEYKRTNNQGYGDLEFRLSDGNNPLDDVDGETLNIEAIFENPIFERLADQGTNSLTNIQYCPYINSDLDPLTGDMFMMFANFVNVSANPIGFVNDGVYEELNGNVIMPTKSININQNSFNLNFNREVNEYTYIAMQDTIYNRYWSDYIEDMFSIKRRIYKYKAKFPDYFLNQLQLNDRLIIKGRRYIINSISSNLTNREDNLELINDIYDAPLVTDTLNTEYFPDQFLLVPAEANNYSVNYVGNNNNDVLKEVLVGTDNFITLTTTRTTSPITNVNFSVSENLTNNLRVQKIANVSNAKQPSITIIQSAVASITADNTAITVDNNIITVDNG